MMMLQSQKCARSLFGKAVELLLSIVFPSATLSATVFAVSILCCLPVSSVFSQQTPLLEKIISLKADKQPLGEVLQQIEKKAGFTFSYNAEIIRAEEIVSIDAQMKSVREIIEMLFGGKITVKEKGAHIILLKAPVITEKPASPSFVKISGYVLDKITGEKLAYASIYNIKTLHAVNTDEFGFYSMKIDRAAFPLQLSYNKINYSDTLLRLERNELPGLLLNVGLMPLPLVIADLADDSLPAAPVIIASVDTQFSFTSPETRTKRRLIEENVGDTLYRKWQVSVLPFAGTNHKLSGRVVNELSFNIFGGFNMGVSKLEVGGFFNINRAAVRKAQIAGLFNYVHGNMQGVQAAGFFNIVHRELSGFQLSGFGNVQIGYADAHQLSGLFNLAAKGIRGTQVGGLFNISGGETGGMQAGGLFNYAHRSVKGAQVAGIFNFAVHDVRGMQLGGFINRARDVRGAQVAGILNIARTAHAMQLGFINIADSVRGVPIGFISIVRKGYISLEVSGDESFYANLTFRTGVRLFYNIFTAGVRLESGSQPLWAAGYGIGSSPKVGKRWHLNFELITQQLYNDSYKLNMHLHNRFIAGVDFIAAKRLALTAGGTLNAMLSQTGYPEFTQTFSPGEPFFIRQYSYSNRLQLNLWWGAKIGLKILLGKGV